MGEIDGAPENPSWQGWSGRLPSVQRLNLIVTIVVFAIAAALALFTEYRSVYYAEAEIYPLCDTAVVRNCTLLADDSHRYVMMSLGFDRQYITDLFERQGIISLSVLNNILLFVDFQIARWIAPSYPYAVVIFLNAVMFLAGMRNVQAIARKLSIDEREIALLYCLNPLMLFTITSLNKEIFGIFLLSAGFRAVLNRRYLTYLLVLGLAVFTRIGFGIALLLTGVRFLVPRVKLAHVMLTLLIGVPAIVIVLEGQLGGSTAPSFFEFSSSLDQRSAQAMSFAAQFLAYPFGPLVTWALVGTIDVLSPALNSSIYALYVQGFDVDAFTSQVSSVLFAVFGAVLATQIVRNRWRFTVSAEFFLFYFVVVASLPISSHRYLIAGWPYLALAVLEYRNTARLKAMNWLNVDGDSAPQSHPA